MTKTLFLTREKGMIGSQCKVDSPKIFSENLIMEKIYLHFQVIGNIFDRTEKNSTIYMSRKIWIVTISYGFAPFNCPSKPCQKATTLKTGFLELEHLDNNEIGAVIHTSIFSKYTSQEKVYCLEHVLAEIKNIFTSLTVQLQQFILCCVPLV